MGKLSYALCRNNIPSSVLQKLPSIFAYIRVQRHPNKSGDPQVYKSISGRLIILETRAADREL
jgi:hypothetical protein